MKVTIKRGSYMRREGADFARYARGQSLDMSEAEIKAYGPARLIIGGKIDMPAKIETGASGQVTLGAARQSPARVQAINDLIGKVDDMRAAEFRAAATELLGEEFRTEKAALEALQAAVADKE